MRQWTSATCFTLPSDLPPALPSASSGTVTSWAEALRLDLERPLDLGLAVEVVELRISLSPTVRLLSNRPASLRPKGLEPTGKKVSPKPRSGLISP